VKLFFCFLLILMNLLQAQEVSYIARSPRALFMGDAYTAMADDEFSLFYNPAALGRNTGVSFTFVDPTIGVTDALSELDRFKNFPSTASGIANRIMDFPIYLQAGIFPTLKMGQFGFTLFANSKSSFMLRNATNPELDINYKYDRGFVMGFAHNVGNGAFSSKTLMGEKSTMSPGERLSIGASIKHMNRQGLDNEFDLFGTTLLNKINSGATDINSLKNAFGYASGDAWGLDTGVEYAHSSGFSSFTSALSILDVGNTHFRKTSGSGDVPTQEMIINGGVAYKQDFGIFDYTLSADIHPMTSSIDFARKLHFGTEVSLPFVTLNAGMSEGYISYGGSVKLWPFKITTGFYGVEVGSHYHQEEARRFILYLSLFDFSIDL
jgi:hypothetical protein